MKTRQLFCDEQGIAFPMAMIVMAILTALMAALAVLSTSEPLIAGNQAASAQARALAESGLERGLWALSAGMRATPPGGALMPDPATGNLPSPVPAPYDGTFVQVSAVGGFKVTVADFEVTPGDLPPNEKLVTAIGYVPNATNPIAIKKLKARVMSMKWVNPPCALCAGGENPPGTTTEVRVGGAADVTAAMTGKFCAGVPVTSAVGSNGTVVTNGTPDLDPPPGGTPTEEGASFPSSMILSDADIALLKSIAKSRGTYYQGSQTWTSPPPDGLIFVDTVDGSVLTASTNPSLIPTVDIHGTWTAGQNWSGWLVVAGSIQISGDPKLNGLIYAQNDVNLNGTGTGNINGAVISTNRVDTTSSTLADSVGIGNAPLVYDCQSVRNGGGTFNYWWLKPGTYREIAGS